MRISLILLSTLLLFFSACGGGGGGGGGVSSGTGDNRSTTPEPIPTPTFSCTSRLGSESGDKSLSCNNNTHVAYSSRENSLCRVDDLDGIAVSTCMETGQTLSAQTCGLGDLSVNCPDVDFSCSVSSLSTSDNWILSCDDNTAVSMDISNNELCRIDLTDRTGFCLDNENVLNKLPAVWTGYAQNFVGIGESVALNTPMWVPSGANFNYSATPANVCSVEAETGSLSIDGYGDCDIALTVSIGESSKVIQKRVHGRLVQNTVWNGYAANSMDFGTTPPALNSPQYAPAGAGYSYASENTDICTVNSSTGEIAAPTNSGDCVITMTSSAANYSDKDISFTLRVDPLDLPSLRWTTPYGSGPFDILTTVSAPSAGALTGQGNLNVTLENYRSTTPTICSVDETTGVPTLFLNGDCIIEAEPSVPGYTAETPLSTTLTVALAAMSLAWTSPISSLGNADSVQPNQPTGVPGATVLLGSLYSSRTPDTCRVNAISGEITGIANGLCTARLTVNFPGYQEGVVDLDITINDPQLTRWSGYSPRDVRFGETPVLADPTDLPNGVVCVYSSLAEDVCTVDDTSGELTLVDAGVCRIRMISSVSDHGDKLFEVDLNVMPLTFPVLGWGTLYGQRPFSCREYGACSDSGQS